MSDAKPKFQWSKSKRRYQYANGKPVADDKLRDWAQTTIDASKDRIGEFTQSLVDGKIELAEWEVRMRAEIRAGHRAIAMLANGGKLDKQAVARLGNAVKAQYKYLTAFKNGLENGEIELTGKVVSRAQMYGQAVRMTYESEVRAREKKAGLKKERRILTAKESCRSANGVTGCVELAAKGWQPIGTLPAIGLATCISQCRCFFVFK